MNTRFGIFALTGMFFAACATTQKPVSQIAPSGNEASLEFSHDARSTMAVLPSARALEARAELQKRKDLGVELMASVAELSLLGGKLEDAAEQARNVLKLDFKNQEAYKTLIKVEIFSGRARGALLVADNALQVQPRSPDIVGLKGLAYFFLDDPFSARDHWKRALEMNPGHVASQMNLATLYLQNRNVSQAGAGFERVLAVQPGNTDAQVGKALVLDLQGHSSQARELLEKIAGANPGAALVQYNLAVLERDRFENYEKALVHLDAYIKVAQKERSGTERALGMREDLRSLVAKKKLGKLSDDELRQMAKKSSPARSVEEDKSRAESKASEKAADKASDKAADKARESASEAASGASKQEEPKRAPGSDDAESLEDAIR